MKKPPENPQTNLIATLDYLQKPSFMLTVNLVWVASLYFYFPPYNLLLKALLFGLGVEVCALLIWKVRLKNWINSPILLGTLSWLIIMGFYWFLIPGSYELRALGLSGTQMILWLLQVFCLVPAIVATVSYFGRGVIERFLDLPPKGSLPPSAQTNGGQLLKP